MKDVGTQLVAVISGEPMRDGVILVVEDDPTLQLVGRLAVSHLGYRCRIAVGGEEAVEQYPDEIMMIFMDIGLPGIDGLTATQLIRKKELEGRLKRTPIVVLTGHADRDRCLSADADDWLQKPALIVDWKGMIDKWLAAD